MNIPDREKIQRLGRPAVQALLATDHAQTVAVRRPGSPDVTLRGLLMPWPDEGRTGPPVDRPEVRTPAWFGLLPHDAPVAQIGFTVIGEDGRAFTPDSPPDPASGVAWILRLVPLVERTRVHDLVFQVPGVGTVEDRATGNRRSAPPTPLPVTVRLATTTDPRLTDLAGADSADLTLIGRWGPLTAPTTRPSSLRWGMKAPLTLDGQPGTLTLKLAYPDEDLHREAQFGGRFLATWRTS